MNKVFVRTTKLSQSRYVNIGWCLHSHAEYSNQELARADLQQRMGKERVDFGLVPHSLSHITSDGSKITTKSMKIRADCNVRQEVLRGLPECTKSGKEDPNLTEMSSTAGWKLILFAQNTLSRDQMMELIKKQNRYLHSVRAISFINLGSLEDLFHQEIVLEGVYGKRTDILTTEEAPAPNNNKKSTGEEGNADSTSNKKRDVNNIDADIEMDDTSHAHDKEDKIAVPEGNTINMEEGGENSTTHYENAEKQDNNGEGSKLATENIRDENAEIQDTDGDGNEAPNYETPDTLLQMLAISAEDACSLFTSWEPGRMGQLYFLTTADLEDRAKEWLDTIMNALLKIYGINKCVRVFDSNVQEMPREETKVCPDSFILYYISILQIEKKSSRERGGKERAPPDNRPAKKRALVVYGNSNSNAWNTPLMDKN